MTDATGNLTQFKGTDWLENLNLPTTLPLNVTIAAEDAPDDITSIVYYKSKVLTYSTGAGDTEPSVPPASIFTDVFWCDVD